MTCTASVSDSSGSFLLAKPDAVHRGLLGDAIAALSSVGLSIVDQFDVLFDRARILDLWPKITGHHVGIEMVSWYLGNGPSRVLEIYGAEAIDGARSVKSKMRHRHGDRILGSLFHSPDSSRDAERERGLLSKWSLPPSTAPEPPRGSAPCWKGLDEHGVEPVRAVGIVRDLLADLADDRFFPVMPTDLEFPGTHAVIVADDPNATPDSILAALVAVDPGRDLRIALACVLQIDLIDCAPVFRGTRDQCQSMREQLMTAGLAAVSVHPVPANVGHQRQPLAGKVGANRQ